MHSRQITIGFDKEIHVAKIVKILAAHFDHVEVGKGITVNGLGQNAIYVHNDERKTRVNKQR